MVSDTWDVQVLSLPNARSHLHWRPPSHDRHTSGRHPPTILIGPSTPAQPIAGLRRRGVRVPRHTFGLADCDQLHTHMTAKNLPAGVPLVWSARAVHFLAPDADVERTRNVDAEAMCQKEHRKACGDGDFEAAK